MSPGQEPDPSLSRCSRQAVDCSLDGGDFSSVLLWL